MGEVIQALYVLMLCCVGNSRGTVQNGEVGGGERVTQRRSSNKRESRVAIQSEASERGVLTLLTGMDGRVLLVGDGREARDEETRGGVVVFSESGMITGTSAATNTPFPRVVPRSAMTLTLHQRS